MSCWLLLDFKREFEFQDSLRIFEPRTHSLLYFIPPIYIGVLKLPTASGMSLGKVSCVYDNACHLIPPSLSPSPVVAVYIMSGVCWYD